MSEALATLKKAAIALPYEQQKELLNMLLVSVRAIEQKQTKESKRGNNYRTTHLTKEEKMVAETLYKVGIDFTGCTPSEAVEWHREVARKGWAPAQYNLACCYQDGKGVERDSSLLGTYTFLFF